MLAKLLRRPVAVLLTFAALVLLGVLAATRLPVGLLPEVGIPRLSVQISYPNVAARTLEESVVSPLPSFYRLQALYWHRTAVDGRSATKTATTRGPTVGTRWQSAMPPTVVVPINTATVNQPFEDFSLASIPRLEPDFTYYTLMRNTYLTVFALLLLLTNCQQDQSETSLPPEKTTEEPLLLLKGTIQSPQLAWYKAILPHYDNAGQLTGYTGYNDANHSLDVFTLTADTLLSLSSVTKLALTGPEKIEEVRGFQYVSEDSIWLVTRNYLQLIDRNGDKLRTLFTGADTDDQLTGLNTAEYQPNVNMGEGIHFALRGDDLYLPLNYFAHDGYAELAGVSDQVALLVRLNFPQMRYEELPVRYAAFLQEDIFGFANRPLFQFSDNQLIYHFVGFPELYVYDLTTEQVEVLEASNDFPRSEPLGGRDVSEQLQTMMQYAGTVISPDGRFLYQPILFPKIPGEARRILIRRVDLRTGDVTYADRPRRTAFEGMLAASDGVYLPLMGEEENTIAFTKLSNFWER